MEGNKIIKETKFQDWIIISSRVAKWRVTNKRLHQTRYSEDDKEYILLVYHNTERDVVWIELYGLSGYFLPLLLNLTKEEALKYKEDIENLIEDLRISCEMRVIKIVSEEDKKLEEKAAAVSNNFQAMEFDSFNMGDDSDNEEDYREGFGMLRELSHKSVSDDGNDLLMNTSESS